MTIHKTKLPSLFLVAAILVSSLALSSCTERKEAKNGQALVRVNGDEITVHQLNEELALESGQESEAQDQIQQRKKALENIIDRQLLANKAMQDGLNLDVDIMLMLERVKSQILAQAYIQKHLENVAGPSDAEIGAFYKAHPNYFALRKIFEMSEIEIDSIDFTDKVEEAANNAKSLDDFIAWIDIHRIKNKVVQALRTSSELPEQIVEKARTADSAKIFIINEAGKTRLLALTPIKESPVSLQDATSGISEFLINKKKEELASSLLQRLRSDSRLEILNLKAIGLDASKTPLFVGSVLRPVSDSANSTNTPGSNSLK